MRFHIIRSNETLYDILSLYNLTKEELVKENKHITSWRNLVPGTKLKIPPIPENVEQGIKDMEPFIEDYYPKLKNISINNVEENPNDNSKEVEFEPNDDKPLDNNLNIKDIPELKHFDDEVYPSNNMVYLYPYYGYYQNYYPQPVARYPVYLPVYIQQETEDD